MLVVATLSIRTSQPNGSPWEESRGTDTFISVGVETPQASDWQSVKGQSRAGSLTPSWEAVMGQNIEIRGCTNCSGVMVRTTETDEDGNVISSSGFICSNCGPVG